MVNVGTQKIKELLLCDTPIWRAYLGETLVFYRGLYPAEDLWPGNTLYPEDDPE